MSLNGNFYLDQSRLEQIFESNKNQKKETFEHWCWFKKSRLLLLLLSFERGKSKSVGVFWNLFLNHRTLRTWKKIN
jgi:hypothetical protein